MSRSTIYAVYRTKATPIAEFSNGWGSAPPLWDYLWDTYIDPSKQTTWLTCDGWNRLYPFIHDARLAECLRRCLAWTFDDFIIKRSQLTAMAASCCYTDEAVRAHGKWGWTHWVAFARCLKEYGDKSHDRRLLGVGLSCTSVADPWSARTMTKRYRPVRSVFREAHTTMQERA